MPAAYAEAYAFQSSLTVEQMLAALNAAGPWAWTLRDSDTYGEYVRTRPDDGPTKLRIISTRDGFLLDIFYLAGSPENRLSRDAVEKVVQDSVLPAVQAQAVTPTGGL